MKWKLCADVSVCEIWCVCPHGAVIIHGPILVCVTYVFAGKETVCFSGMLVCFARISVRSGVLLYLPGHEPISKEEAFKTNVSFPSMDF